MHHQAGIPIAHALRLGIAALGLLLIGALDHPNADARISPVSASIDAPARGAQVDGVVEIRGRATVSGGARFGFYRILIGVGRAPAVMRPLGPPYDRPVESGVLATWDTDRFPSGEYLLALHVYDAEDGYETASTVVTVKQKPTPTPPGNPAAYRWYRAHAGAHAGADRRGRSGRCADCPRRSDSFVRRRRAIRPGAGADRNDRPAEGRRPDPTDPARPEQSRAVSS